MTETQPREDGTGTLDRSAGWRLPSQNEFVRYAEDTVAGALTSLEEERRTVARKAVRIIVIGILLGLATPFIVGPFFLLVAKSRAEGMDFMRIFAPVSALLVGLAVSYFGYLLVTHDFRLRFKTDLINPLVRFFGADFSYQPLACIDFDTFLASRLFPGQLNELSGQDYISGTAGKTKFQACELLAQEKSEDVKEDGTRTTGYTTLFKGLFFVGEFNKAFTGTVIVLPRSKLARDASGASVGELVKLEDPEFSKIFCVYATDQILARYVLTPSLMLRIVEYRTMVGRDVYLSFVNGVLYVAVKTGLALFEPKLFSPLDATQYVRNFDDIHTVLGIVEELNLNTRLWTKR
jgi:hypothetical protein